MHCMAIILCLAALGAATGRCLAAPGEALWSGQVAVESRGNLRAYNSHSGAAGIVQIRMAALADINRIARNMGLAVQYTPADRYHAAKAREMWHLYLAYYGACYTDETGLQPNDQVYARIWNGGPTGWKKRDTHSYWTRVRNLMTQDSEEEAPAARTAEALPEPSPLTPGQAAPASGDGPAEPSERPAAEPAPDADAPAAQASAAADGTPAAPPKGTLAAIAMIIAISAPLVLRARAAR